MIPFRQALLFRQECSNNGSHKHREEQKQFTEAFDSVVREMGRVVHENIALLHLLEFQQEKIGDGVGLKDAQDRIEKSLDTLKMINGGREL